VVPLEWSITLRRKGTGRSSAKIYGPSQERGVWAIADDDGLAVLAALCAAILAGPSTVLLGREAGCSECPVTMFLPEPG
jgi:hypothetical protein